MSADPILPQSQPHVSTPPVLVPEPVTQARPPRRQNTGSTVALILLMLLLVLVLGLGVGLYLLDQSYAGKIYPNVTVLGVQVGERTPTEAEQLLRARYGTFLDQPATITLEEQMLQPSLEELGVQFNFDGAINTAYRAGRGNGLLANLREVAAIWQNGLDLPLQVTYDERQTQRYLMQVAETINRPPVDATLRVDGTVVRTTPAQIGRQVLVNEALAELSAGLRAFTPTNVRMRVRELPPRLTDASVQEAAAQLKVLFSGPINMRVGEEQVSWQPADLADMVEISRVSNGATDTITINANAFVVDRIIQQLAERTEHVGTRPRVAWNNGNLKITKPGNNGWRIDEPRAREQMIAALFGRSPREFDAITRELPPPVNESNLDQLGITSLVSVGKSDFTGSASYRIHNIGVGMSILNGILIAPGEEFSFNDNIGNIDASQGFVEGAAIVQNRTQQEFGGGICQDSTTMFRAAFWAGLPITERWGHSFYISWYDRYALGPLGNGPGLDATIFTGGPDLKFVNDTGAWLLIQSWSNPKTGVAQVELYGPKINRQVKLTHRVYDEVPAPTKPVYVADSKQPRGWMKQSDRARGGMTIDVIRTVYVDGVAHEPNRFRTRFKPWPNIFVVNPADMGPDGKPIYLNQPAPQPEAPAPDPTLPPVDPNAPPAPAPSGAYPGRTS